MSNKPHMTKEEIYMFLLEKAIYYRDIEGLICSIEQNDPMYDVHYFIAEGYLKFSDDAQIHKIKNELVLSKSFHNFVVDEYRRKFTTWKVRKVEKINLMFSDQENKIMNDIGFTNNDKYLYAYIGKKSTCFRLGLKFLRGNDNRICKFKVCKSLKDLITKLYEKTNMVDMEFSVNDIYFIHYVVNKNNKNLDFIKKNGKISKSLLTNYYKKIAKKMFNYIESGSVSTEL